MTSSAPNRDALLHCLGHLRRLLDAAASGVSDPTRRDAEDWPARRADLAALHAELQSAPAPGPAEPLTRAAAACRRTAADLGAWLTRRETALHAERRALAQRLDALRGDLRALRPETLVGPIVETVNDWLDTLADLYHATADWQTLAHDAVERHLADTPGLLDEPDPARPTAAAHAIDRALRDTDRMAAAATARLRADFAHTVAPGIAAALDALDIRLARHGDTVDCGELPRPTLDGIDWTACAMHDECEPEPEPEPAQYLTAQNAAAAPPKSETPPADTVREAARAAVERIRQRFRTQVYESAAQRLAADLYALIDAAEQRGKDIERRLGEAQTKGAALDARIEAVRCAGVALECVAGAV
ncbi:MAG: hypothetical protein P8011_15880 [Acidihalobacter sp.]|uniref:hypothetical protein n=1 Tax=Acidihalobacter sp. TaxID=1872108 RepID=UPI00307DF854